MMDLTDGLGKDLAAILPENASANISLEELPISDDAHQCAHQDGTSAKEHAFCDGEDYELLFTLASGSDFEAFAKKWRQRFPDINLSAIGTIVQKQSDTLYLDAKTGGDLAWQAGFEHFNKP